MTTKIHNLVIVGTGPAGLTAAIYAARAGLSPIIYAGLMHGGQLTTTTEIENSLGFAHGIMGPQLMADMTAQAERFGTKIIYDSISRVDFSSGIKRLWTDSEEIHAKAVIICTGATAKTMKLPHEGELIGRGISTCATCDGFFYKNKKVLVVGGGDSAMEEAGYLTKLCSQVTLVHRRNTFAASPIMSERALKNPKINFKLPFALSSFVFDESGVKGAIIENLETGEKEEIEADGIFYAIGHSPNSEIFLPYVDVDKNQYIKVEDFTKTKTPGVFAAGDIADPFFRQAITAAGMGCQAAIQAQHYLETLEE